KLVPAALLAPVRVGFVVATYAARLVALPLAAAPPERRRVPSAVQISVRLLVPVDLDSRLIPELQLA
ncbi:hypothetical protein CCHL11_07055, partial [Colletotrichum chlorophyti]